MIQQAYARTNLEKQEAMIDEWKRENGWIDNQPTPVAKTPEKSNAFLFSTTAAEKQDSEKRRADYKTQREANAKKLPLFAKNTMQQQSEYREKYNAQKAGNPDPIYYYSMFQGKVKQQKRKNPLPDLSNYQPFTGKYTPQKGDNPARLIMGLLAKHEYIDVDTLVNQLNFNRQAFLAHAKKLEKLGLLTMVKNGLTVVYLEGVR